MPLVSIDGFFPGNVSSFLLHLTGSKSFPDHLLAFRNGDPFCAVGLFDRVRRFPFDVDSQKRERLSRRLERFPLSHHCLLRRRLLRTSGGSVDLHLRIFTGCSMVMGEGNVVDARH